MSYTHYFTQLRDFTKEEWKEVCLDIQEILKDIQHNQGIALANGLGEPGTSPIINENNILFNGLGDDHSETMLITRKRRPKQWKGDTMGRYFCKTIRHNYDLAVTACLCYLDSITENYRIGSDGHGIDFLDGLEEAKRALPRYANRLDIPRGVMEDDRWEGSPSTHILCRDDYFFGFCIDGHAYILELKGQKRSYRFHNQKEAAQWALAHIDIIDPMGHFDNDRISKLKRQQKKLFKTMIDSLSFYPERAVNPPEYVRPGQMPPLEISGYNFEDYLV